MDFSPLFNSALQFKQLILGVGLLVVIFPYPLSRLLAVVIVLALLIVFAPASVPYLLAVWHTLVNLFAFLFMGVGSSTV